jgi:hypothetical protein
MTLLIGLQIRNNYLGLLKAVGYETSATSVEPSSEEI